VLKIFILLRKGQSGKKLEKQVAIFLLFSVNAPTAQKSNFLSSTENVRPILLFASRGILVLFIALAKRLDSQ